MQKQNIRIIQLIDSLEPGGAERMAVNYANALVDKLSFSGLGATRKEGELKQQLKQSVHYTFLHKRNNLDLKAFLKLRSYCVQNKIDFIHAHSSSFFWAVLVKLTHPKVKVIWHDHFGNRVKQAKPDFMLKLFSRFFYLVIAVNEELQEWSVEKLNAKTVLYLPNFSLQDQEHEKKETSLKGEKGKRIVFLANLKNPKNHLLFLKAFYRSSVYEEGWTVHLIGKNFEDTYAQHILDFIKEKNLQSSIYLYGSCNDIPHILKQGTLGVLSSTYEGFPVTLLEYGTYGLSVLSTNVGYCSKLIENEKTGLLFDPLDEEGIAGLLTRLTDAEALEQMKKFGANLKQKIEQRYGVEKVITDYIEVLK